MRARAIGPFDRFVQEEDEDGDEDENEKNLRRRSSFVQGLLRKYLTRSRRFMKDQNHEPSFSDVQAFLRYSFSHSCRSSVLDFIT
jgi:hypothetical protein